MKINTVSSYNVQPLNFGNKNNVTVPSEIETIKEKHSYSGKEISAAVLATALSAATIGGMVMHGKGQKAFNKIAKENGNLINECGKLKYEIEEKVSTLKQVQEKNTKLTEELRKTKDKFQDIFEGDFAPKECREKIYTDFKNKVDSGKLGYNPEEPPITGKGKRSFSDEIPLPEAGTTNRINMKSLDIPEIAPDGSFDFKLPTSPEVKLSHAECKEIKPVPNQLTTITESYSDSVQWNNDKIARDVLQNFFDGHGQTLDGVQMTFTPATNGKFKIRIKGDSTYTPDKAIYIGESTKRNNSKAAGNYGEGLKMSVLKLLKDAGADNVKIGSDNWKVTYNLQKGNLSDKRVLAYSLDKVDRFDGNYIEFETSDKNLLETFRKSINRFYHSGNEHFKCPDFENDIIGIKLVPEQKGGVYIAGQRFEVDNDYDGLKNVIIFLKEKPPVSVLDPSRDRTSLNNSNFKSLGEWISNNHFLEKNESAKLLKTLEPYWDYKTFSEKTTPIYFFIDEFLFWEKIQNRLHIKFPEKYVAYSNASPDVVLDLRSNGYRVCNERFSDLGMQTIKELMGDVRKHDPIKPDELQTKKILVLKEAIQNLGKTLKNKEFTPEELDTKIYLFNNKSLNESRMYSSTKAEAIIDKGTSKGFWIDKDYLDKSEFSDVLETALHELSHKVGGDESAEFSYKLTDVNSQAIHQMMNDVQSKNELQALNRIWNELTTAQKLEVKNTVQ